MIQFLSESSEFSGYNEKMAIKLIPIGFFLNRAFSQLDFSYVGLFPFTGMIVGSW